jgi:putative ABC transport system permease protein
MPDWAGEVRARLSSLRLSPTREREIVEELSQHLEDQYEQALSRGASETEARQSVLSEWNDNELLAPALKRVERRVPQNPVQMGTERKTNMIADLRQDARYGLRMLLRNPAFTAIAVLALALGIGANSAIFSVVNALLLRPLPYKNPEQLVVIWENATHLGFPKNTPPPANFLDWQKQNTLFEGMGAFAERTFNLTGVGEPERLEGRRVSANLFDLLGVKPILGRTFVQEEDKPGTKVALLNESLWKRRFGSDPGVIGRALALNGES